MSKQVNVQIKKPPNEIVWIAEYAKCHITYVQKIIAGTRAASGAKGQKVFEGVNKWNEKVAAFDE